MSPDNTHTHVRALAYAHAQAFGAGGGGRKSSAAPAYIRISEQEIADDYPLPKQYNKGGFATVAAAQMTTPCPNSTIQMVRCLEPGPVVPVTCPCGPEIL
eukprot:1134186-Pelagomonas_calceolata.AAC.4